MRGYPRRTSLGLSLSFIFISGCTPEPETVPMVARAVPAVQVADIGHLAGRSFPGRAKATQEVDLAFRVAGPLIEFPVIVGTSVTRGDGVATLDPRDFEVAVTRVDGQLDQARGKLTRAQNDFKRLQNVQREDPGATSQTAVDRTRADLDTARGSVKSLEADLARARDALADTNLQAPFDATVVATYVENFESVRAKQPILRLLNTDRVEMVVSIPETLIAQARYVEDITVVFDAFSGTEIPAQIKEVGSEASATTRTYPVTLIMDQPEDITVLPGMAGTATGHVRPPGTSEEASISIPLAATFSPDTSGETYVWVIDEEAGRASRRAVTLGQLSNEGIVVTSGLQAGEWIAVAGVNTMREGQPVRIAAEPE